MKSSIIITLIIFTQLTGYTQNTEHLDEIIKAALNNSNELKIARSKYESSDAKVQEVSSQFLPQINLSAGYTRLSSVPDFQISVPFSPAPITVSEAILNNYNVRLNVQQSLYTGNRLSSMRNSMKYLRDATKTDVETEKNNLALNVTTAYWNLYKLSQSKKVIEESIRSAQSNLAKTSNFLDNGLATKNDVLKIEVQISNLELNLIEIQNNIETAQLSLNKLTGIDEARYTYFSQPEPEYDLAEINIYLNEASVNRNEMKSIKDRINANMENITAAESGYYPSVSLFGNYYMSNPNQRYQPPESKFNGTWDIGLALNWDLWNWGETAAQVTQAEQNLIQVRTNREQLIDAIELEVNQAYHNYKFSLQKIETTLKTIEQAEENLRIMKNKYDENLATSTDLIEAENLVLSAKIALNNASADNEIAKAKLNKAAGRKLY